MKTLIAYLKDYQLLPVKRTAEAIKDITGQKISEGTIVNVSEELSASLEELKQLPSLPPYFLRELGRAVLPVPHRQGTWQGHSQP
jgi:hypothetical protein